MAGNAKKPMDKGWHGSVFCRSGESAGWWSPQQADQEFLGGMVEKKMKKMVAYFCICLCRTPEEWASAVTTTNHNEEP